jgi:HD-like signal output (HDOD) protein
MNKLRNAALSMSISRMWTQVRTPPGWSTARFNLHSAATAVLTDLLSQRVPVPYPEGGFVAGLLHDIGKLLAAVSLPEEPWNPEVFGTGHAEISGAVLARWNLPLPIQEAVLFHHSPGEAAGGELHLALLVNAADKLANDLGAELIFCYVSKGECLRRLKLNEDLRYRQDEWRGYIKNWFEHYSV